MQNVGTPRFYVDILQWLKSQGSLNVLSSQWETEDLMNLIGINPSESVELIPKEENDDVGINDTIVYYMGAGSELKSVMPDDKNFFMVLGHNLKSSGASIYLQEGSDTYESLAVSGLVNYAYSESDSVIDYDGFLISIGNDAHDVVEDRISFRLDSIADSYTDDIKIGSLLYGTYYDMPHSPDLNLKITYEYDGIKSQQTKGGATLSNALYTKPADWGTLDYGTAIDPRPLGAWQLETPAGGGITAPSFRSGRRMWDLSFSYLSDSDIFPDNANTGLYSGGSEDNFDTNILNDTDFFSAVWNKTLGGHLPFIFQPDNTNANPDQFAICRFDMDSLQYDQVAHNVYNLKLKIREVW